MCHKPLVDHDGNIQPKYKQPPASAERRKDMLCAIESLRHTGFSSKSSIDLVGDILKVNQVLAEKSTLFEVPDQISDSVLGYILTLK